MILCSPTEPESLRAIGTTSRLPEARGADVLLPGARLVAIQRKTIDDLILSLADGRMEREMALLRQAAGKGAAPFLLLEGRPAWSASGFLEMGKRRYTFHQWLGLWLSAQMIHGLGVLQTGSLRETVETVRFAHDWLGKREHRGLFVRPTANVTSEWGKATDRDWARHILQSFPGVGPTLADAIYEAFGRAPLDWSVSREEMARVEGIGPKRLAALWEALERGRGGGHGQSGAAGGPEADQQPGGAGQAARPRRRKAAQPAG